MVNTTSTSIKSRDIRPRSVRGRRTSADSFGPPWRKWRGENAAQRRQRLVSVERAPLPGLSRKVESGQQGHTQPTTLRDFRQLNASQSKTTPIYDSSPVLRGPGAWALLPTFSSTRELGCRKHSPPPGSDVSKLKLGEACPALQLVFLCKTPVQTSQWSHRDPHPMINLQKSSSRSYSTIACIDLPLYPILRA
ncbi:hypothetical protein BU26DRAFT_175751 [Trematosphaeria pertusa]|uniref:Uncharacterized protein n=1 Tax=Trematosphaeria pertusa TaxID=390896 RepID=A0A6A6HU72_9PLEO|nr:uncharacterized protein BU26DRAFT_175751 [Trematosphaeria pertusa]KAF2241308.1 hypothetical protein BU26DRAFT_175751 [Trematosphaeria pertusa]